MEGRHAAVDQRIAAGGEAAFRGCQEGDRGGDLSWIAHAADGDGGDDVARRVGAAGRGRISAASRRDFAIAAAVALVQEKALIYELGGPAFDLEELAGAITEAAGTKVTYRDLPVEDYADHLRRNGLDDPTADFVAALDDSIAKGELETDSQDLERLLEPAVQIIGSADRLR